MPPANGGTSPPTSGPPSPVGPGGGDGSINAGDAVIVIIHGGRVQGTVRFVGQVPFAEGTFYGVELDDAVGKNDGTVKGIKYFSCPPNHGIFVRKNLLEKGTLHPAERHNALERIPSTPKEKLQAHMETVRHTVRSKATSTARAGGGVASTPGNSSVKGTTSSQVAPRPPTSAEKPGGQEILMARRELSVGGMTMTAGLPGVAKTSSLKRASQAQDAVRRHMSYEPANPQGDTPTLSPKVCFSLDNKDGSGDDSSSNRGNADSPTQAATSQANGVKALGGPAELVEARDAFENLKKVLVETEQLVASAISAAGSPDAILAGDTATTAKAKAKTDEPGLGGSSFVNTVLWDALRSRIQTLVERSIADAIKTSEKRLDERQLERTALVEHSIAEAIKASEQRLEEKLQSVVLEKPTSTDASSQCQAQAEQESKSLQEVEVQTTYSSQGLQEVLAPKLSQPWFGSTAAGAIREAFPSQRGDEDEALAQVRSSMRQSLIRYAAESLPVEEQGADEAHLPSSWPEKQPPKAVLPSAEPAREVEHVTLDAHSTGQLQAGGSSSSTAKGPSGKASKPKTPRRPTVYLDVQDPEVSEVSHQLPRAPRICILGGTKVHEEYVETLTVAFATHCWRRLSKKIAVVTGGMAGVQEIFAKSLGTDFATLVNLMPAGVASNYEMGVDITAGRDAAARLDVLSKVGHIYVTIAGGPAVAKEAKAAEERGAIVLPVIASGSASAGLYEFPEKALQPPAGISEELWSLLKDKDRPDRAAKALLDIILHLLDSHDFDIPSKEFARSVAFQDLPEALQSCIRKVERQFPEQQPRLGLIVDTRWRSPQNSVLLQALGQAICKELSGQVAVFMAVGDDERAAASAALAKGLSGDFKEFFCLLPPDRISSCDDSVDIYAGEDADIVAEMSYHVGQVYLMIAGREEEVRAAQTVVARGGIVVPLAYSGFGCRGMFGCPKAVLERPSAVSPATWQALQSADSAEAEAVAAIQAVQEIVKQQWKLVTPQAVLGGEGCSWTAAARKVKQELGAKPIIALLAERELRDAANNGARLKEIASALVGTLGEEALYVNAFSGSAEEVFVDSLQSALGAESADCLLNLTLPRDKIKSGRSVPVGDVPEERCELWKRLVDVFIVVEGVKDTSALVEEILTVDDGGSTGSKALVLPVAATGFAAGGLFSFPKKALQKPPYVACEHWQGLQDKAHTGVMAMAVASIVKSYRAHIWRPQGRDDGLTQEAAATRIQAVHRGAAGRAAVADLRRASKSNKPLEEKADANSGLSRDAAATRIQALHRGGVGRSKAADKAAPAQRTDSEEQGSAEPTQAERLAKTIEIASQPESGPPQAGAVELPLSCYLPPADTQATPPHVEAKLRREAARDALAKALASENGAEERCDSLRRGLQARECANALQRLDLRGKLQSSLRTAVAEQLRKGAHRCLHDDGYREQTDAVGRRVLVCDTCGQVVDKQPEYKPSEAEDAAALRVRAAAKLRERLAANSKEGTAAMVLGMQARKCATTLMRMDEQQKLEPKLRSTLAAQRRREDGRCLHEDGFREEADAMGKVRLVCDACGCDMETAPNAAATEDRLPPRSAAEVPQRPKMIDVRDAVREGLQRASEKSCQALLVGLHARRCANKLVRLDERGGMEFKLRQAHATQLRLAKAPCAHDDGCREEADNTGRTRLVCDTCGQEVQAGRSESTSLNSKECKHEDGCREVVQTDGSIHYVCDLCGKPVESS
eukprot:TRINITY_DN44861_c0_g1_i1.p1 TRINITY_DN44861_c0_g1~~TRINITY_DN44861_c0_g1_i1.p1  ORF type:complete len:1732 (-),score=378.13 TRINITY_DN44861_c0_g1_i1:454-5649(-)